MTLSTTPDPLTAATRGAPAVRRPWFVLTILTGSFLLFMVQPLVARMALPRLGGAPAVWNSAMLVYQGLLLAGYAYAHWLGRFTIRRQATLHLAVLVVAALWLPVGLADMASPAPGTEALWVPLLLAASIGPLFFAVAAQAPLMQRWFAADPRAGDPYALYAASNVGSFAGLLAYPLLVEPNLPLAMQSWGWAAGYGALILLVGGAAAGRWAVGDRAPVEAHAATDDAGRPSWGMMLRWVALAAVPSGLMLSTTTHLTTDVFAVPLLWVIPLGLYLLSFSIAFADRQGLAGLFVVLAPPVLLLTGGLTLSSGGIAAWLAALYGVCMMFVLAVALHNAMYRLRPDPRYLTLFYLVMAAGGVVGGLFAALFAPMLFDWVYEHPILVVAAALLMPLPPLFPWAQSLNLNHRNERIAVLVLVAIALGTAWWTHSTWAWKVTPLVLVQLGIMVACGMLVIGHRAAFVVVLIALMLSAGGVETVKRSFDGSRIRSYFGVYTVTDDLVSNRRSLAHGTTMHGQQSLDPALSRVPTSYYGAHSGVGLALKQGGAALGGGMRVGVIGLGTGTLACYRQPGQAWDFYEIDPAVVSLARDSGRFTYLSQCAPDARMLVGDARVELARGPAAQYDVLVVDAFSSDAIPLHLLTREAIDVYHRALRPGGIMLIHISNRFFDLEPVLAADVAARGWSAAIRKDLPSVDANAAGHTASDWIAISADPARLAALTGPLVPRDRAQGAAGWYPLYRDAAIAGWTDDYASIIPAFRWGRQTGE